MINAIAYNPVGINAQKQWRSSSRSGRVRSCFLIFQKKHQDSRPDPKSQFATLDLLVSNAVGVPWLDCVNSEAPSLGQMCEEEDDTEFIGRSISDRSPVQDFRLDLPFSHGG